MSRWPWPRVGHLAVTALAMWGLKHHYATANVDELGWILKPVARLSELVSGARFEWQPGEGYLSRERFFVIAKPCAGLNFMLAALAMLGSLLSQRAISWRASARLTVASVGVCYAATVIANTIRIVVALWLAAHPFTTAFWTAARVHRLEGIVVYFGVLLALHLAIGHFSKTDDATQVGRLPQGTALPLAAYYLVTVVIPLANGSGDTGRAFLEHMSVVVLGPLTLVGLLCLLRHAWQKLERGDVTRRATRDMSA